MNKKYDSKTPLVVLIAITLICAVAGLVILKALLPSAGVNVFNFHFGIFSYLMMMSSVSLIFLLVIAHRPKNRSRTTFWFSLFVTAVFFANLAGLLSQASNSPQAFLYWVVIGQLGVALITPAYFLFTLSFVGEEEHIYRTSVMFAILSSMLLIYLGSTRDGIINNLSQTHPSSGLGYPIPQTGPYSGIFIIWFFGFLLASAIFLIRYYRRVKSKPRLRRQTMWLFASLVLPLLFILPATNIPAAHSISWLLIVIGNACQVSIIGFAIFRYGLFNIDPTTLAETILRTMNESVITINLHLEIQHINSAASKFFGVKPEAVEGQGLQQIFGEANSQQISQKLKNSDSEAFELMVAADSRSVPVSLLASKILNSDNSVAGYILVFRDISKEHAAKSEIESQVVERTQQLHAERAKLRASIESLSAGFAIADNNQNIVIRNLAINKIMNLEPSAQLKLEDLAKPLADHPEIIKKFQQAYDSHRVFEMSDVSYSTKILRIFMAPILVRDPTQPPQVGTVVLVEDVTEERIMERSKDEFFSIASHELRTPLTAIKGNTSMILDYFADQLKDPTVKEMITDIHGSSTRLIDIVNDFLDLSRLEQGKMVLKPTEIDLEKIIESVAYEMKVVLQSKQLYLHFDTHTLGELPKVWGDGNRVKQIIYNLIGNAAKFTEKGGVTVNALAQDSGMIKVLVSDTGPGISPEGQALLFHKFQQAGNSLLTRDTTRGTGLGLYISKMLVEKMGGHIQLEHSEVGKGTTFSFTLPVATEQLKAQAAKAATATTDTDTGLMTTAPIATKQST